ncbi:AAA family ATPase [Candidatus Pacearchaeota archaeon]|nr:AAA family ATPase [Candidatus Pacearchaeota archaeon]
MSFYIILRGPAGSGKTTLAQRLTEIYHAHYISIDKVKSARGLKHSEPEKLEANKAVLQDARTHLSQGQIVIIDEVLYYKSQLSQLMNNLPFPHYVFSLKVPLEVCLARNVERRNNGSRKMSDDDVKEVYDLVSKLNYGIEINTHNRSIEDSLTEIISHFVYLILY